ncbi:MAG: 3-keto-disaccharide hydrolase [Lentimonas sp.]
MDVRSFILSTLFASAVVAQSFAKFPIGDPPGDHYPWGVHDWNRPQPPIVEPASKVGGAPSDAVVLFDGTEESFHENWVHTKPDDERENDWYFEDGAFVCAPGAGYIATKEHFGDCQLHIEWQAPPVIESKKGQGRGNSGVFLMGKLEVQVLDNYNNPTYADGTVGAVYAVMPPAVNPLRDPGEWQSYDIIFRRPIVREGVVIDEGSMTVLINGVVVQDSTPLDGGGGYKKRKPLNTWYPEKGPLSLQDHGNPVRFRNVWYRSLRPRATDGGTDGRLTKEVSMAKRAEIAAGIREQAAGLQGLKKIEKLLTAHVYLYEADAWAESDALVSEFVAQFDGASDETIQTRKWDIINIFNKLDYLEYHKIVEPGYEPRSELKAIADAREWLKKK